MLVLSKRLLGVPLMSLQTGSMIGTTGEPIIDPRRLHIIAFYCEGPMLDARPAVLHSNDIRELSDIGIIIDSSDNVMPPGDLIRLQEVIEFGFSLLGVQVVTDRGHKLGTVEDYATDALTFLIEKLHVKRPFPHNLHTSGLIIDRKEILEVTNSKIIVKSATVKEDRKDTVGETIQSFANPFRKPQAEISKSKTY